MPRRPSPSAPALLAFLSGGRASQTPLIAGAARRPNGEVGITLRHPLDVSITIARLDRHLQAPEAFPGERLILKVTPSSHFDEVTVGTPSSATGTEVRLKEAQATQGGLHAGAVGHNAE